MARDIVKEICRATRRKFSAEEKIRIVLEGLRGEISVSELCRREGIAMCQLRSGRLVLVVNDREVARTPLPMVYSD